MESHDTSFRAILGDALNIYKKNFWLYTSFALIAGVISYLIALPISQYGPITPLQNAKFFFPTYILIYLLQSFFIAVLSFSVFDAANKMDHEEKTTFLNSLGNVLSKFSDIISLWWKIFLYTWGWLELIVSMIILYYAFFMYSDKPESLVIVTGLFALYLLVLFIRLYRIIRSGFSYVIFITHEGVEPQKALEKSLQITENNFWIVIANYFLWGIVTGAAILIITFISIPIVTAIVGNEINLANSADYSNRVHFIGEILRIPFTVIIIAIGFLFQYAFMKHLIAKKAAPAASTVHIKEPS